MQIPSQVPDILVRIIEGRVPAARAKLVQILRVPHRSPDPTHVIPPSAKEVLFIGNKDSVDADVEGMLTHVAFDGTYLLVDAIHLYTRELLPPVGRIVRVSGHQFTNLIY